MTDNGSKGEHDLKRVKRDTSAPPLVGKMMSTFKEEQDDLVEQRRTQNVAQFHYEVSTPPTATVDRSNRSVASAA